MLSLVIIWYVSFGGNNFRPRLVPRGVQRSRRRRTECAWKNCRTYFLPKARAPIDRPRTGRIIFLSMSTVTDSSSSTPLLVQREITEASGDLSQSLDSNLMTKDLQTEKLILVVYSIIELVGIIGNLYVIIWSLVGSKKV